MSICRYDTNKPCENHGTSSRTCIDCILDKIRTEIEDVAFDWQEIDGEHESFMVVDLDGVLQIIDKYKGRKRGIKNDG